MPDTRIGLFGSFRRLADASTGEALVVSSGELVALPAEGLWVDVDEFRSAAARARRSSDPGACAEAIELHRDGLLPDDRYEDGAIGSRDDSRRGAVGPRRHVRR